MRVYDTCLLDDTDTIKKLLGEGTFGKVFFCHDSKHDDYVAVKVVRKISRYIDSALIEASILTKVYDKQKESQSNVCLKLYSQFYHHGKE